MGYHSTYDAPLLRWRLCCRFAGFVALIALTSLPSLCWQLCPCFYVLVLLSLVHLCCCRHCAGIFTSIVLGLLPSTRWYLCLHCAGIIALDVLVSLLLLCWNCFPLHWCCNPHHAAIFTSVALVSLPLLQWRLHHCPSSICCCW